MLRPTTPTKALRAWATAAYFVLFVTMLWLFMGAYVDPSWRAGFVEAAFPGFYSHASNLVISAALVLVYGVLRAFMGASLREIAVFTAVVIAANYFYEVVLTLWNTRDIVDAHFGLVGSLLMFAFAAAVHRWGIKRPA